jgi:hypothetical protein
MLQGAGTRMCRHYAIATDSSRAPRVDRVERDKFRRCDAQRPTATLNRSSRYGHPQRRRQQPWTRCIKARRRAWTCPCVRTKEGSLRHSTTSVRAAATTTLSPQSDAMFRAAFSPVRAISKRRPREPTQHVRNACARNPYVPRVVGDPCAYARKRRLCKPRVLPGQSMPRSTVSPLRATRAQRVRQKPLCTKGFQLSMRFGRKASRSALRQRSRTPWRTLTAAAHIAVVFGRRVDRVQLEVAQP